MSEKILRWGVLSTSNIGRVAVNPAIQASSNGELLAVASREEGRAGEFAEKAGIPQHYGSYEALLDVGCYCVNLSRTIVGREPVEVRAMVEHFADCALTGGPLRYTGEEAALNMRVIEALYESAGKDGEIVAVS
jgi:predicted dehydrogenase